MKIYATVDEEGKLNTHSSKAIKSELMKHSCGSVEVDINKPRKKRSVKQNSLYWVYVQIISDELGYSKEEIHQIIAYKFLKYERVVESTGEVLTGIKSTTTLTTSEFKKLLEQLYKWASESFSIVLPEPDEQLKAKL